MSSAMANGIELAKATFDELLTEAAGREHYGTFMLEIDVNGKIITEVRKKVEDRRRPRKDK